MRILFKRNLLAIAITMGVAACGGSSGGGLTPPAPASTAYTVAVDAPDSLQQVTALGWEKKISHFFFPAAIAADGSSLLAENFTVVVVDAEGNVVEEVAIAAENISKNPDGTWEISVPGDPRLDCLIVVDINKPVEITLGAGIPAEALYAPTTAIQIDVDVASTAAYQNFIEELAATPGQTFEALGLDVDSPEDVAAVEAVVEKIQELFEELTKDGSLDLTLGSLEQILAAADAKVEEIIEQEVSNVVNATTGTAAELMNSGGLFWYDGEFDQLGGMSTDLAVYELERGYISATGGETFTQYNFDATDKGWADTQTFDPSVDTAEYDRILTSDGWANSADVFSVVAIDDENGTFTIQDVAQGLVQEKITAVQVTNLDGRNIEDFMAVSSGDFSQIIESDKMFAADAKAYRVAVTHVNDVYNLWFDVDTKGDDSGECEYRSSTPALLGGNCETVGRIVASVYQEVTNTLSDLISAQMTANPNTNDDDFVGIDISRDNDGNVIMAELVADNTANFYVYRGSGLGRYTLLATSSWSYQTPAGLANGQNIIVLPIPDVVFAEGDFDTDERTFILAEDQGLVRRGNFIAAGSVQEEADNWVFNATANDSILAAVDFEFLDSLTVTYLDESNWGEELYDGLGGPETGSAFTYKAFDRSTLLTRSLSVRGVDFNITAEDIVDTFYDTNSDGSEFITFNADGTGSSNEGQDTFAFTWSINDAGYIINDYGDAIQENGYEFSVLETAAAVSDPSSGTVTLKVFFQNSLWQQIGPNVTDDPVISENQGEIYQIQWSRTPPQAEL
jgi:hypothetical protein